MEKLKRRYRYAAPDRRVRIRMNVLHEPADGKAYLGRDGQWTTWNKAALFHSQNAADGFAKQHGIETYGLF